MSSKQKWLARLLVGSFCCVIFLFAVLSSLDVDVMTGTLQLSWNREHPEEGGVRPGGVHGPDDALELPKSSLRGT